MSFITKIRKHSKTLVIILVITMLGFAAEEFIFYLAKKGEVKNEQQQSIAKVGFTYIPAKRYLNEIEKLKYHFQSQYHMPMPDFFLNYYKDRILNDLINEVVYKDLADYHGFAVGEKELIDMIQGEHIHEQIKQYFKDPKDNKFHKEKLLERLEEIAVNPDQQAGWNNFEQQIAALRRKEKIDNLLDQTLYTNKLEILWEWQIEKTRADIKYLFIPYEKIADEDIKMSNWKFNRGLRRFFKKHKNEYKTEEKNTIHYAILKYQQSEEDINTENETLKDLLNDFKGAEEAEAFAKAETDGDKNEVKLNFKKQEEIPSAIQGMTIGSFKIVKDNNIYGKNKIYKYIGKDKQGNFEYIVIEQKKIIGDSTKNDLLESVKEIQKCKNAELFDRYAIEHGMKTDISEVKITDQRINGIGNVREFIHWIFKTGNACNIVSNPIEIEDGLIIGIVSKHIKKGILPLDEVKDEVVDKYKKHLKYKAIRKKINDDYTIEKIKQNVGEQNVIIGEVNNVDCKEKTLQKGVYAKYALYKILRLADGTSSKLIEDRDGAFIISMQKSTCVPVVNAKGQRTEEYKKFAEKISKEFNNKNKALNEKDIQETKGVTSYINQIM